MVVINENKCVKCKYVIVFFHAESNLTNAMSVALTTRMPERLLTNLFQSLMINFSPKKKYQSNSIPGKITLYNLLVKLSFCKYYGSIITFGAIK